MFVFYSTRSHDSRQYPEVYTLRSVCQGRHLIDVETQAAYLVKASQMHGPSACVWMVPGTEDR